MHTVTILWIDVKIHTKARMERGREREREGGTEERKRERGTDRREREREGQTGEKERKAHRGEKRGGKRE